MNHLKPEQSFSGYYMLPYFHSTVSPSSNGHVRDFVYLPIVGSVHFNILYNIGCDGLMTDPSNRSSKATT